jgi:hypothetical protein
VGLVAQWDSSWTEEYKIYTITPSLDVSHTESSNGVSPAMVYSKTDYPVLLSKDLRISYQILFVSKYKHLRSDPL